MSLLIKARNALREPLLSGVDIEGEDRITVHRRILARKHMIRGVFEEFYRLLIRLDAELFSGQGLRIEIGSGVSEFKALCPDLVTTDIVLAEHLDMVLDAHEMPFKDRTIRAVFGLNCFHHFRDPDRFFRELTRVLVPGGGCILVEPFHGMLAEAFYKRVFESETFDKAQKDWSSDAGVMDRANQALSYIVFERDFARFNASHPTLAVLRKQWLPNYPRYLISGGLNFRQLLPSFCIPLLKGIESLVTPLGPLLALHHYIVIRKRN